MAVALRRIALAEGKSISDEQSIRPFLAKLERQGELLRIGKSVDPRYEVSAFLSAADPGPALLFESVTGSSLKVVGNLLTGRARIAAALGIGIREILPAICHSVSFWPEPLGHSTRNSSP